MAAYMRFGPPHTPMIRYLEKEIEQDAVERAEHAIDETRLDQKRAHVLRNARRDHLPSRPDHEHRDEAVQQDEENRDSVDP